jgi:actin related protein 2/3 complex subunit 2
MAMSAPFEVAFESQLSNQETGFMAVDYRDQESLYVKASHDRVTVIFSVLFRDESDKILAKVFLQVNNIKISI